MARRLAAKKYSGPFQPFFVAVGDFLPTFNSVPGHIRKNIEPVFLLFVLFDVVHGA
jgi:hypothetical protein